MKKLLLPIILALLTPLVSHSLLSISTVLSMIVFLIGAMLIIPSYFLEDIINISLIVSTGLNFREDMYYPLSLIISENRLQLLKNMVCYNYRLYNFKN